MCEYIKSMQHSTAQHSTAQRSTAQHSAAQRSTAQRSAAHQHRPALQGNPLHSTAEHGTTGYNTAEDLLSQNTSTDYSSMRHSAAGQCRSLEHTPVSLDHAAKRLPKVMASSSLSPTSVHSTLSAYKSLPAHVTEP